MGRQVIFTTDPIGNANPWGNLEVQRFCFNATEWEAQNRAFTDVALQLGYFCLAVGFIIGIIAGYLWAKRKYGCSE